ncbi:RAMP superfamily protein [Beggiatoa alba B18LD]|uniref:RAMP superfamily protein n=1 Tax=Beggiatoa alba B18LD TaxID=395493 RepID=I3CJU9_9GAMM|nr:RAMP superfamily CRISPR-associated protein [Beggiatoa alba]EIJ43892.1 RAMP superfamily protein [Beggiatoa alba B18LD]
MEHYLFEVTLNIHAPVLTQATGGRAHGLDTITLRDNEGKPCLLGSSVRGNLRQTWEFFNRIYPQANIDIKTWLGAKSEFDEDTDENSSNEPQRANLFFSYYWQAQTVENSEKSVRHRIKISEEGTVEEGALQVIETPFITGQVVSFKGNIRAFLKDKEEKERLLRWLNKGLAYISAIGAMRGVGFGRIESVAVKEIPLPELKKANIPKNAVFGIALKFDRPFCFAKHHHGNNHFAAETVVSGAAILGALMRQCHQHDELKKSISFIKISHAFACEESNEKEKKRSMAIPYSFVEADKKLYDVSLKKTAGLIKNCAPAFSVDWKGETWGNASKLCGQLDLERSVNIRTAIEEGTNRAKDESLFSMEVIHPQDYVWLANIDCEAIPEVERKAVLSELANIFSVELVGLGKTKATATVTVYQEPFKFLVENELPKQNNAQFVLMLQTPALLLPNPYDIPATNGGDALHQQYAKTWENLANEAGAFRLSHFYARQTLVGGGYLQKRFWSKHPYNPQVLTCAGSIFVFDIVNFEKTLEILKKWIKTGLPQHSETLGGSAWNENPYIANNGYGEIVINPQWQGLGGLDKDWEELA